MSLNKYNTAYNRIISYLKELNKEEETYQKTKHSINVTNSIYEFNESQYEPAFINFQNTNIHDVFKHPEENEKLGAKLILEIFEIFRNSHLTILQNLVLENTQLKNELRVSKNYISNLEKKISSFSFSWNKNFPGDLKEYTNEFKLVPHPSRQNCSDMVENIEEKVLLNNFRQIKFWKI